MFYKPVTTESEYFRRIFFFLFAISMTDFCQWALCYRWLGNYWILTQVNTSVKLNNLHRWGHVNFPPSSTAQTFLAMMIEVRGMWDFCCAIFLETILRKLPQSHHAARNNWSAWGMKDVFWKCWNSNWKIISKHNALVIFYIVIIYDNGVETPDI